MTIDNVDEFVDLYMEKLANEIPNDYKVMNTLLKWAEMKKKENGNLTDEITALKVTIIDELNRIGGIDTSTPDLPSVASLSENSDGLST